MVNVKRFQISSSGRLKRRRKSELPMRMPPLRVLTTTLNFSGKNRRLKMRSGMLRVLTMCALSAAVSSCGNRDETHLQFPPVADLRQVAEPEYPIEALAPGEEGRVAEDAWRDKILIWGRQGWAQNKRVCQWAVELGLDVPRGYCGE